MKEFFKKSLGSRTIKANLAQAVAGTGAVIAAYPNIVREAIEKGTWAPVIIIAGIWINYMHQHYWRAKTTTPMGERDGGGET